MPTLMLAAALMVLAGPEDSELAGLRKQVVELDRDNARLAKELADLRDEASRLRKENERLRRAAGPDAEKQIVEDAMAVMLDFFKEFKRMMDADLVEPDVQATMLTLQAAIFQAWRTKDPLRTELSKRAGKWLAREISEMNRRAESRRWVQENQVSPANLREWMNTTDRAARAEAITKCVGREVRWTGTVTDAVNDDRSPWHVEIECEGVLLRGRMAALKAMNRPAIGEEYTIVGTVEAVDGATWSGIIVTANAAVGAKLMSDVCDLERKFRRP